MIPHKAKRCQICNGPLTVHQAVVGICSDERCRQAAIRNAADAKRERERSAMRAAAEEWLKDQVGHTRHALIVLPARSTECVATPFELKEAMIENIREALSEGHGIAIEVDRVSDAENLPEPHRALATACATCRGYCCRNGGSRAFIDGRTMERVRREHPEWDDESIVAIYRDAVPDHHVEGSCVFHGQKGCTLGREYRSQICNEFYCAPVRQWFVSEATKPGPSAVAVVDGGRVVRGAVVEEQPR